jgi:hydroxymethylpyrimidine/phosphomethylpyrimidine kinase
MKELRGRVLVIAGSDSSGGAGLQADVKTITALGGYATTAVTALTAQNTLGVFAVEPVSPEFVDLQIQVVLDDLGTDAVKIGMLHSRATIEIVARRLRSWGRPVPVVLDPVVVSSSGTPLLDREGCMALAQKLVPLATLLTPNAVEAALLTGVEVRTVDDMQHAAERLLLMGAEAVLVKGGHIPGDVVVDLLRTADGVERRFEGPRVTTRPTHGTGCTLASAIAVGLAEGMTLEGAVQKAREYVVEAIRNAPSYGEGLAPLNHAHSVE